MAAHAGVLEALIERGQTGRGKGLAVSLFDGMADWMNVPLLYFEGTGIAPPRMGLSHPSICPYGAFATLDSSLVLISIQNEREWADFCAHFLANRPAVDAHVATKFAGLTRDAAAERLRRANTAYGFVNGVADLGKHPALRRVSVDTANGPVSLVAPPVSLSEGPRELGPVPAIGAHTAAIQAEFA
jgi:crotonobetainyl-CoA:carnitine CoA-transferase CaiB-like acyl-CoA transferase